MWEIHLWSSWQSEESAPHLGQGLPRACGSGIEIESGKVVP